MALLAAIAAALAFGPRSDARPIGEGSDDEGMAEACWCRDPVIDDGPWVRGAGFAQTKPEGEMRFALYVTIAPAWLDPGGAGPGNLTPFWMLYALHDALLKPMSGSRMAPSLAESWTESVSASCFWYSSSTSGQPPYAKLRSSALPIAAGPTPDGFVPNAGLGFAVLRGMVCHACAAAPSTIRDR
jgi:hypothetical protein